MSAVWGRGSELARFGPERFQPSILFGSERINAVLVALEEGQHIDLHAPPVDMAVAVLAGAGDVWIDDGPKRLRAGDVAVVPAGVTRGVRATNGRMVLLHVVSPPPDPSMHEVEHRPWPAAERSTDAAAPIRAEHRELLPHLDHLAALAEEAPTLQPAELARRLDAVLGFLRDVLLPHAETEEAVLYPAIDGLLRAEGGATRTMSLDHRAIGSAIDELGALAEGDPSEDRRRLQRTLDGLVASIRLHFEKEEEAYLPLLEQLAPEEARELEAALAEAPGHGHVH